MWGHSPNSCRMSRRVIHLLRMPFTVVSAVAHAPTSTSAPSQDSSWAVFQNANEWALLRDRLSRDVAVWDAWVLVRHGVSIPSRPHHLSSPACCLTWGVAASGSAAAKCRNSSHCTPQTCSVTCGVGHGTPSLLIACRRPGAFPSAPRVCTGACVQSFAPSSTSSVPLARWLLAPTA
jgi:hypothetical protein